MNKNMGKNKLQLKKLDVVVIIVCLLILPGREYII